MATAWSSYQASRWNGEQAKAASRTNAIRIEAARAQGLAEAQTDRRDDVHPVGFTRADETELADFYFKRFRAEFKPAVVAWLATKPLANPDAPLTPFAMPRYRLAATATKSDWTRRRSSAAAVRRDIQRATNYVLGVVLFAVSLFFAGMSAKLRTPGPRVALLVVGCVVFVGTAIWIATFPISLSV